MKIDTLFDKCKDWLFEFDGAVCEVFFLNCDFERLPSLIKELARSPEIKMTPKVDLEDENNVLKLRNDLMKGQISQLILDCKIPLFFKEVPIRILIDRFDSIFDLTIVWWREDLFRDGNEKKVFNLWIEFLLTLKELLRATDFFMGPENNKTPRDDVSGWCKVDVT